MSNLIPFADAVTGAHLPRADADAVTGRVAPGLMRLARDHGVQAAICHDLALYATLRDRDPERATWSALVRPEYQPSAGPHDTAIAVLHRDGVPIATYAARLKWLDGDLATAINDLSLIYERPAEAPPGVWWHCDAPSARHIADCQIALGMGIWADQVACGRDRMLTPVLARLIMVYAAAEWRWSQFLGFSLLRPSRRHAFASYGAAGMEDGVRFGDGATATRTRLVYATRARFRALMLDPRFLDLDVDLDDIWAAQAA